MSSTILTPPNCVKFMRVLDKKLFNKVINVPCINVTGTKLSGVIPIVKKCLLKMRHLKPIQTIQNVHDNPTAEETHILLNPTLVENWSMLNDTMQKELESKSITKDMFTIREFSITYDNWGANEILKAVLPDDKEGVASFTQTGHVVHVNLREHLLDYKQLIGQVLLDKVSNCKTVVNKVQNIDNTYRNFQMEVLAGEKDMMVKVKENLCTFEFDISTVYWNSRLSREHERIVDGVNRGDILFDVFSGVGPFAIPAAKKKCTVFANDLNPDSFKWLNHNMKINKIDTNLMQTFMKDGHDFIKSDIRNNLLKYMNESKNVHITMNLPAIAVEFLKDFVGLYKENELSKDNINFPIVHVYCFVKTMEDPHEIAKQLVEQHLGYCLSDDILIDIFNVRTVSNYKEMMRITFKLNHKLLLGQEEKKRKYSDDVEGGEGANTKKH